MYVASTLRWTTPFKDGILQIEVALKVMPLVQELVEVEDEDDVGDDSDELGVDVDTSDISDVVDVCLSSDLVSSSDFFSLSSVSGSFFSS